VILLTIEYQDYRGQILGTKINGEPKKVLVDDEGSQYVKTTGRHILSAGRQVATASDQAIVPTGGFNHICVVNDGTVELRLCIDGDSTLGVNIIYISAGESFDGYLAGSALHYSVASGTAAFRYVLS
jgi:hypothetical protein